MTGAQKKSDAYKLMDSQKTREYNLKGAEKTDEYELMDSQKTREYNLKGTQKTDEYELMDSQKTREYNLNSRQKIDEYEIAGALNPCEQTKKVKIHVCKTVHVSECERMTEFKSFTAIRENVHVKMLTRSWSSEIQWTMTEFLLSQEQK